MITLPSRDTLPVLKQAPEASSNRECFATEHIAFLFFLFFLWMFSCFDFSGVTLVNYAWVRLMYICESQLTIEVYLPGLSLAGGEPRSGLGIT